MKDIEKGMMMVMMRGMTMAMTKVTAKLKIFVADMPVARTTISNHTKYLS